MTPEEFEAALKTLGYSQTEFGKLIDRSQQTVHRWCVGYVAHKGGKKLTPPPREIALLVDAMLKGYRPPDPEG